MNIDLLYALGFTLLSAAFLAHTLRNKRDVKPVEIEQHKPSGIYVRVEADRADLAQALHAAEQRVADTRRFANRVAWAAHRANGRAAKLSGLVDIAALELARAGLHQKSDELRARCQEFCGEKRRSA